LQERRVAKKKGSILAVVVLVVVLLVVYTQLTIFVVPPIGAVPEGKTLVILRLNKGEFIDSADAMCERMQGSVNLLCRGSMLGAVAKNTKILLRLPYSETLYLISTGGTTYSK
jgi:hypothetical protein